jgi:hypothetical protein
MLGTEYSYQFRRSSSLMVLYYLHIVNIIIVWIAQPEYYIRKMQ